MKKFFQNISILSAVLLIVPICYLAVIGITGFATNVINSEWYNLLNSLICIFTLIAIVLIVFRSKKWDKIILILTMVLVVIGSIVYFNKKQELKYPRETVALDNDAYIVEATVEDESVAKVLIKDGVMDIISTNACGTTDVIAKDREGNEHKYTVIATMDEFYIREEE